MEVRELQWFVTLASTENVTNAADELHISQPTLSRALGRLERQLGVQLFDRQQNRIRLNKYGEIFLVHARRALTELEQADERIRTLIDPSRGVVALGFLHSFGEWLVPEVIEHYRERAPGVTFELVGGALDTIVDAVRSGRSDVGLVAPQPGADDMAWIPLGREVLYLEVPDGDEFVGRDEVSIAEIAERPLLALGRQYGLRQVSDRLFNDAGLVPTIAIEATELPTLRALVRHNNGVAIVPAPSQDRSATPTLIPISYPGAHREYGAVVRPDGPTGSAARAFVDFLRDESDRCVEDSR